MPKPGPARWLGARGAAGGRKSVVVRYGLAAGSFALILLLSVGVHRFFGYKFGPTSFVIITMIASAWYLARGPGLLAVLFEATIDYFSPPALRSVLVGEVCALAPGRGGNVPAAALTAYVREEDRARALAVGFQTHIAKPVDPAALAAAAWLAKLDGRARSPRKEVSEL